MPSKTPVQTTAPEEITEAELNKFANGRELRNVAYVEALCQSLQSKMLAYYHAGASAKERLKHINDIAHALKSINFKVGNKEFTIAAKEEETEIAGKLIETYTCELPKICVGGACVDPPPPPPGG